MTGFTSPTNKCSTPPITSPLNKGFEPTIKNSSLINSIGIGEFNDYPLHQDGASIIKGNINLANVGITLTNLALNPTTTETTSITSENKKKLTLSKKWLKTNVPSLLSDIKACLLDSIQFYDSFIPVTKLYSDTQNHKQPAEPKKLIHLYLHLVSAIKKITTAKDINPDIKQNILFQDIIPDCNNQFNYQYISWQFISNFHACFYNYKEPSDENHSDSIGLALSEPNKIKEQCFNLFTRKEDTIGSKLFLLSKNIEENYGKKIIANRPDTYISKDIENILINKPLKQANFTNEKITEESTLNLQKLLCKKFYLLPEAIKKVVINEIEKKNITIIRMTYPYIEQDENNRLLEKIIQCVHENFVEVCKKYNDNFTNVILEDIERIFLTDLKSGVYDFMIKDYINHKLSTFDSSNSHASN
ncbi:hypothetical protein ACTFIZ_007516 [Dictyostelium cf. discoideum]